MVYERKKAEVVDFSNPYRVTVLVADLGKRMEEVKEFKYLGTVLCKHGEMDGKRRGRAVKVGVLQDHLQGL